MYCKSPSTQVRIKPGSDKRSDGGPGSAFVPGRILRYTFSDLPRSIPRSNVSSLVQRAPHYAFFNPSRDLCSAPDCSYRRVGDALDLWTDSLIGSAGLSGRNPQASGRDPARRHAANVGRKTRLFRSLELARFW